MFEGKPQCLKENIYYTTAEYGLHITQYLRGFAFKSTLAGMFNYIYFLNHPGHLCCYCLFTFLVVSFPEKMTGGVFSSKGPVREQLKSQKFTSTLIGHGWSEKLVDHSDEHSKEPDASIVVKVSGPDPGYGATSLMMVASAMTILREKHNCTGRGGVMAPGTAFMNTNLIQRLQDRGMTFTIE
ncbi:unnamed protein product, partial [Meganyctiphanes norvegica]